MTFDWKIGAWLLLMPFGAVAADPEVHVAKDGQIVGKVDLDVPEREVRDFLDDADRVAGLSPDVLDIDTRRVDGCVDAVKKTRGLFSPLSIHTRRCPTEQGWSEQMVESEDFHSFESHWEVSAVGGATRVTYKVVTDVDLPLPKRIIRKNVVDGVRHALQELVERLVGKKKKKKKRKSTD